VRVAFLAAQQRDGWFGAGRFAERAALPFPILLDADRAVCRAYGVHRWITWSGPVNVARPSAFLVDRTGIIRTVFLGGRNTRPKTDVLLEEIARLKSS
jgi:peroxiredoxin